MYPQISYDYVRVSPRLVRMLGIKSNKNKDERGKSGIKSRLGCIIKKKENSKRAGQRTVRGPGDDQVGSLRAEKMLKDESRDNLEQCRISCLKTGLGSLQHS